jgi:hypothetical protein
VATYSDLVPGFLALHQRVQRQEEALPLKGSRGAETLPSLGVLSELEAMRRFFEASRDLSLRPRAERDETLGLPKPAP